MTPYRGVESTVDGLNFVGLEGAAPPLRVVSFGVASFYL